MIFTAFALESFLNGTARKKGLLLIGEAPSFSHGLLLVVALDKEKMFDSWAVQPFLCFGCLGWAWKRCSAGADDCKAWGPVYVHEFRPVPRICRLILAADEHDLGYPKWAPSGGDNLNPDWLVKRRRWVAAHLTSSISTTTTVSWSSYPGSQPRPRNGLLYFAGQPVGMQTFDGGYVHRGFMKAPAWLLDQGSETLTRLWVENGSCYRLVFARHSLRSGVAALINLDPTRVESAGEVRRATSETVAPARCVSGQVFRCHQLRRVKGSSILFAAFATVN